MELSLQADYIMLIIGNGSKLKALFEISIEIVSSFAEKKGTLEFSLFPWNIHITAELFSQSALRRCTSIAIFLVKLCQALVKFRRAKFSP